MDCQLRERDLDALGVEGSLQAAQVLAADRLLLEWGDLEPRTKDHGRVSPSLDAHHLEGIQNPAAELGVGTQLLGRANHHLHGAIDGFADDALVARDGLYAALWRLQTGG